MSEKEERDKERGGEEGGGGGEGGEERGAGVGGGKGEEGGRGRGKEGLGGGGGEGQEQGCAAQVLGELPGQLMDEKLKGSLDLVDITFTCKVCGMKAKSLQELLGHMKDGQCPIKKRPRGRPRKVDMPDQDKQPPKPKEPIVIQPTERVTRVKSGAIKRKSVADLFIKQEPTSSDEEYEDETVKRRRKKRDDEPYICASEMKKENALSGTEALAANKEAKLSGHEVRIPIGSLRQGEAKIIKLNTATGESPEELSGSILQIREVDNKPIVEVLPEAEEAEKASTTIYLRTGTRKNDEEEEQMLKEVQDSVQFVEMSPHELMAEMTQGEVNDANDVNVDATMEQEQHDVDNDANEFTELSNVQLDQVPNMNAAPEPKKRRYTKLPPALESKVVTVESNVKQESYSTKCKKCVQRWFQTKEELDIHYRLHGQGKDLGYQCDKCDYKCSNWGRMQYHIVKHPEYCEQLRGTHMMKNIFGSFACPECGKMFEFKSNLSTHFAKMHNRDSKFCPNCAQMFNNMDDKRFERHLDRCKGENIVCEFCPYTTTVRSNMRIHLRVHSGEGFTCDICGKVFPTKQRYEVHHLKHTNDRQRFPCEHCGADFCSKDAVKKHVQRIHMEKEVLYKCSLCVYTTKHQADLKKHMKCVHEKKYQCHLEGCEYGTNRMDQLTLHSEYHNPDRIYKCSYANCYTAFSSHRNLQGHMQGVHKIGCRHQCPICLKFFKKKTVLLRHLVSHTTERPYSCHECGETFTCHSTYYRHRNRTGHDSRREGVASVPQNITIQYMDPPVGEVMASNGEQADNFTGLDVPELAVVAQKVLQQELPINDPSNSLMDDSAQVITLDATQFAQFQQQQQQQPESILNEPNVTYYVYEGEGGKEEEKILVMESQLENGEKQTLEAIPLDENADISAEIEDYNTQFINLDLPNGPAFVKVDSGGLMVMNSLNQTLETEEVVAESMDSAAKTELLSLGEVTQETNGEEVVYQDMGYVNDASKEQYVIYHENGEETVVEGESAAAYGMLQLQGGKVNGTDMQ